MFNLWLECDSILVVHTFQNLNLVPYKLRNRWINCIEKKYIHFLVGHIYREDNIFADLFVFHATSIIGLSWWDSVSISSFVEVKFYKNRDELSNYRFKLLFCLHWFSFAPMPCTFSLSLLLMQFLWFDF